MIDKILSPELIEQARRIHDSEGAKFDGYGGLTIELERIKKEIIEPNREQIDDKIARLIEREARG